MHWRPMLTLPWKRSRSSQGHDLYTHCSTWAIDALCQVSLKSIHRFWRRRFLKGFYHIWALRPSWSWSCDLDYLYIQWLPLPIDASHKIWLWLANRFQRRWCLNIMVIYMYIAPGWGHMSPWGPFFSESLIFSPTAHFLQDFHFKWHFKSFHHSNALATYVDLAVE